MPPAYFTPRRPRPSFTSLYDQARLVIDPSADRLAVARRLLSRTVSRPNGCLEMTGYKANGYVSIWAFGIDRRSHIVSYDLFVARHVGSRLLQIHHTCENKACVNPDHLERLTAYEHARRHLNVGGINAAKTECVNGHPFSPENTIVSGNPIRRACVTCRRETEKRRMAKPENREKARKSCGRWKARMRLKIQAVRSEIERAVSAGAHLIAETGARAGYAPMLDVCRAEFCARAGIDDPNPGRAA